MRALAADLSVDIETSISQMSNENGGHPGGAKRNMAASADFLIGPSDPAGRLEEEQQLRICKNEQQE